MLTWDDLGRINTTVSWTWKSVGGEILANKNVQYAVQPHYVAANVFRFLAPPRRLTHWLRWEPGRASFKTMTAARGAGLSLNASLRPACPCQAPRTVRLNLCYFPLLVSTPYRGRRGRH